MQSIWGLHDIQCKIFDYYMIYKGRIQGSYMIYNIKLKLSYYEEKVTK